MSEYYEPQKPGLPPSLQGQHVGDVTPETQRVTAHPGPSSMSDDALRGLAERRGYSIKKTRGKDQYRLLGADGNASNASWTKNQLDEYLRSLPLEDEEGE